ncbi:MAG: site-2 protease family protein [Alistipes indistinctus]
MDIVIKVLQFILSFSLLVIIHEFGHFFFARLFGTRVEKFYLFFNPWFSLFKFKKGETTLRRRMDSFRRLCEDCRHDRRSRWIPSR